MVEAMTAWLTGMQTDTALWVLVLAFIALDVVLGTCTAWSKGEISSKKARQGVMHKTGFIGAMLLCNLIDVAQGIADFGYHVPVTVLCAMMIVTCEVMSICEHIQEINPDINLKFLESAKKDRGEHDKDEDA